MLKMGFRWYGAADDVIPLSHIRQIPGVSQVVGGLFDVPTGEVWPLAAIQARRDEIEAAGLKFEVVESVNVHDDIKIGGPERDRWIDYYATTIGHLARCGVKVICYNFMPVFDWIRTDLRRRLPDGSFALAFQAAAVSGRPQDMLDRVRSQTGGFSLPGWEPDRLAHLEALFEAYQGLDEAGLAENFRYFIQGVAAACQRWDMRLAVHPDDPPWSVFGLPRIVKDAADLRRIESFWDSPYNGFTLCTGSLGENRANDVPAIIREFCARDKVPFVHARNILHLDGRDFRESAHLSSQGSLDMCAIMRALAESGYDGYLRPDHGRDIWGERGRPGYGLYDRALGIAYLNGLWEALNDGA